MAVVLYSSTGCEYCKRIKADLASWGVVYEDRNVTENPAYFDEVYEQGLFSVPVTFVEGEPVIGYRPNLMKKKLTEMGLMGSPDSPPQSNPVASQALAEETEAEAVFTVLTADVLQTAYDLVIIGGGPAGASAAVYASRSRLKTLVIDKAPTAGALALTHKIANYPGVLGEVSGLELLTLMRKQARQFGATFVRSNIVSVALAGEQKTIRLPEGDVQARSVFVAVGSRGRATKVQGEERFEGRGVSYCATCDAAFFQNKVVAVVGDNAEAAEDALLLARFAKEVHIYLPGKSWAKDVTQEQFANVSNVHTYPQHALREVVGDDALQGIVVGGPEGDQASDVDGVFIYLSGNRPGTDFLGDQVERDADGYVVVDELLRTSVQGVFAGGDARRTPVKQAVVAAADGAVAAMAADKHIHGRNRVVAQYS